MAVPVQQGTTVKLGFGSLAYIGYVPIDGVSFSRPARLEHVIPNTTGDTQTRIIVDKATVIQATFVILGTGSITPPDEGALLSVTSPDNVVSQFMVLGATVSLSRGASKLGVSMIKEDSITYAV